VAICHRSEIRIYDRTGTGAYEVLPASSIKWSWQLGGGGFLNLQAEAGAEPLASNPTLLDDCVIKIALPLAEPGTTLTEVAAFANRGRAGTLWDGAGQQVREVRGAGSLFTVWSQDAVLHPEGNAIAQMSLPERYFGWMSTIYDPADDAGQWGTPSANAGQQDSTTGNRAGQPADWPTELGNAYWITRGTLANGTRHLFIADCVVPTTSYLTVYFSADESCAVYFGGSLVMQPSSSETGYTEMSTWSGYVRAGTYRVGIDKTSVVSRGGDGRDPVLLAVATNTDTGGVDDILLVTNTTDWQIYTTDPIDGTVPSLTPGAIVVELAAQAAARNVATWSGLTLDFDADTDTASQPWPVREERAWRIAYDRHLDMLEGLGDLGFCPEIGPDLTLKAWGNRGTDRSATVTLATLDEVDRVGESGTGVAATYLPVETQDGWVIVENPTAAATYGRRESALSLGNAPSIAQGKRLGQKVLDDRLAKPETERAVEFYARAGSVPFVNFFLGDTVSLTVGASTTKGVVLDLAAEQDHTEAIVRWTAKVTGDGVTGETRSARFATQPGNALAEGAIAWLLETIPATFATTEGSATAAGGVGRLGDLNSARFVTLEGSAVAAGNEGFLGDGVFRTTVGSAVASGGICALGPLPGDDLALALMLMNTGLPTSYEHSGLLLMGA
jgi:hypothetical protein